MNHPDFRVAGKTFATAGYPDKAHGMVKLSPQDQSFLRIDGSDYGKDFTMAGKLGACKREDLNFQSISFVMSGTSLA